MRCPDRSLSNHVCPGHFDPHCTARVKGSAKQATRVMHASTSIALLLWLAAGLTTAVQDPRQQLVVREGGFTFKLSASDDDRSTPYRVFFWDESLAGSSYRFTTDGRLTYFKAGREIYYDRVETDDGSFRFRGTKARGAGGSLAVDKEEDGLRAEKADETAVATHFKCMQCTDTVEAICDVGLPGLCDTMDRSTLGRDGASSVQIMCANFQAACRSARHQCGDVCSEGEKRPLACKLCYFGGKPVKSGWGRHKSGGTYVGLGHRSSILFRRKSLQVCHFFFHESMAGNGLEDSGATSSSQRRLSYLYGVKKLGDQNGPDPLTCARTR